jgi:DNA-binding XRE family transcriptional regulator
VALSRPQALKLAGALRGLRESTWPERRLTQAQLASALDVTGATLSSWESTTNPKPPPERRISAYARFFSTQRSLEGEPHLVPEDQLTADELRSRTSLPCSMPRFGKAPSSSTKGPWS